jgi:hypothetical protein
VYEPRVENEFNLDFSILFMDDDYFIFPMFIKFNIPQIYSEDYKCYWKVNGGIQNNIKLPEVGFMRHITWFVLLLHLSHMAQFIQSENIYFLKDRFSKLQLEKKSVWAVQCVYNMESLTLWTLSVIPC